MARGSGRNCRPSWPSRHRGGTTVFPRGPSRGGVGGTVEVLAVGGTLEGLQEVAARADTELCVTLREVSFDSPSSDE